MAMEAMYQLAPENRLVSGFWIKEADFLQALVVRSGQGAECSVHVKPLQRPYEKDATSCEVRIYLCRTDDTWVECCRAIVQNTYHDRAADRHHMREHQLETQQILNKYQHSVQSCTRQIKKSFFYEYHASHGLRWGPSFQHLQDFRWNGFDTSIAILRISDNEFHRTRIVHPTVLDVAWQMTWMGPTRGLTHSIPTEVPRKISNTWVSAIGWSYPSTGAIRVMTTSCRRPGFRVTEGSTYAIADDGTVLLSVGNIKLAPAASALIPIDQSKQLCHEIDWKPQLSTLTPRQLQGVVQANGLGEIRGLTSIFSPKLESTILVTMRQALRDLDESSQQPKAKHLQKYVSWMRHRVEVAHENPSSIDSLSELAAGEQSLQNIAGTFSPGVSGFQALITVARKMNQILSEEIDPVNILSPGLIHSFYESSIRNICDTRFDCVIDLLAHETPELKILELNAGECLMTFQVASSLHRIEDLTGGSRYKEFCVTDQSIPTLNSDQMKSMGVKNRMVFKALDMERDLGEQGLTPSSYDLVIASNVSAPDILVSNPSTFRGRKYIGYRSSPASTDPIHSNFKVPSTISAISSYLENIRKALRP
jgi:hypothetical protein